MAGQGTQQRRAQPSWEVALSMFQVAAPAQQGEPVDFEKDTATPLASPSGMTSSLGQGRQGLPTAREVGFPQG